MYQLGVCHDGFHLRGLTRALRNADREVQKENVFPQWYSNPVPSAYEANELTIALLDLIFVEHLKVDLYKMLCLELHFINSLQSTNVRLFSSQTAKRYKNYLTTIHEK